ncbi:MAG: tetratricopeptide repeat protein [Candidatus Kapabacteria bacterium]|nr:tetratricopeptide repeat protein [Candidatus Kapabacteria bacterium]
MTNQELLAGFLDRSLNEDQLLEFEQRKLDSPEFAQEVREMLTVEHLLADSAPKVRLPIEFLAKVESSVAAQIIAGAATGGILGTIAKFGWGWIAGGTTAAVVGGTALYVAATRSDDVQPDPRPTKIMSAPTTTPTTTPPVIEQPSVAEPAPTPAPVVVREVSKVDVSLKATPTSSAVDQLRADYETCSTANDRVRCAQIALQIGRKLRQTQRSSEAETYLTSAIAHARAARLAQFEVDALGELGLVMAERGDVQQAASYFQKAIDRGQSARIVTTAWSTALENLNR